MVRLLTALTRYSVIAVTIAVALAVLLLHVAGFAEAGRWLAIGYVSVIVAWTAGDMARDVMRGNFGLDVLALVAMVATLLVDEYVASLIIVLMLSGGEALEDYAARRARRELTALLDRSPQVAHLIVDPENEASGEVRDVAADDVDVGDVLLIRPGEIVPVDGELLDAEAAFDESSLTGESLPAPKEAGAEVLSGSINGSRAVRIRTLRRSGDSQYQQIVALVSQAQASKVPVVRIADRFAVPFTAVSLAIAGVAWWLSGDATRFAEVLVLATPCPLLIAAPVAFLGGMSRAAKAGVIVKGGAVMEQLARVRSAAFDKTGTLTGGRPQLVAVRAEPGFRADDVLSLAASAEQYSSHVLAASIHRAATERELPIRPAEAADEVATNGVVATIGGRQVVVGKPAYVASLAPDTRRVELRSGETAAYVAVDGRFAGVLVLADHARPESPAVVTWLRAHGVRRVAMLTGDTQDTAAAIAADVGITEVHAELLPPDKVQVAARLRPRPVLVIGDGVNDAPMLAAADVGIAMGARGATAAGGAADAVLLQDSVTGVADAVSLGKHTLRTAYVAIWIGIALSVGLMLVATTGAIPAVAGALTQELVDLATIGYALRALAGPLARLPEGPGVSTRLASQGALPGRGELG